ncbi:class I SAM-dependent methyltransferase [Nocardioides zeae]|uniref:Class I SAM-dependent methyltransferase n=1 Tax=Nocardioides imazamoxiresistens TaxID=3231893 RepID=A0ABU3PT59_9ACTN|nr:class I SAM-dependent methyltransferase [Nocardioides zeae]MDT9592364.1 class I SAM-dependent methyltransferase [Nocardioides zeae]
MSTLWRRIATEDAGEDYARAYAERFRRLAARGVDVHGEAALVAQLLPPPARVLDGGCGTGRIAVRLAELGYEVVGSDVDASMVAVARDDAPHLEWHVADLAAPEPVTEPVDLVLLAGNVLPLVDRGDLPAVGRHLVRQLAPGGRVLAGFGLDADHLPGDCPVLDLGLVDTAFSEAGLVSTGRWSSWDRDAFTGEGYVVATWAAA